VHYDFLTGRSGPNKWQYFGLLFAKANLLYFKLISNFKEWFVVGILRIQKQFDVHVFDFEVEVYVDILAILATFFLHWENFVINHLVTHDEKLIRASPA